MRWWTTPPPELRYRSPTGYCGNMTTTIATTPRVSLELAAREWGTARGIAGNPGGYLYATGSAAYAALPRSIRGGTLTQRGRFALVDPNGPRGPRSIQGWHSLGAILRRTGQITVLDTAKGLRYVAAPVAAPVEAPVVEAPVVAPAPVEAPTGERLTVTFRELAAGDVIVAIEDHQLPRTHTVCDNHRRAADGAVALVHPNPAAGIEWWIYPANGDAFTVIRPSRVAGGAR